MLNGISVILSCSVFVRVSDKVLFCYHCCLQYILMTLVNCVTPINGCFLILSADDIILISCSVTMLQNNLSVKRNQ